MAGTAQDGRVEIRLLGPPEAVVDGRPVALGGPQPRTILTLLALSTGTAVATSRLVDDLWPDAPPPGAVNTVQVYVSRLRRAIQPSAADPVLRATSGGYLLDLPRDAVDALRFERLAAAGHAQLRAGDPQGAVPVLTRALELWRAPVPADLGGPIAGGLIARLHARRIAAHLDRIDAWLALGRPADALPELHELVRLHPLDESLVERLMRALYHCGRQAEALEAYAAIARRLAHELGVEPGPGLRQVQAAVLAHDLDPTTTGTAGANGSAFAGGPGGSGPVTRSLQTLLRSRGELIGRRAELERTLQLLAEPGARLVTLLGAGGIGKTRLALAVTDALNATAGPGLQPDRPRAVMVPLAGVTEDGELLATVCRVLAGRSGRPDRAGPDALDDAARLLIDGPAVLVLDNMEQLVDRPGSLADIVALLDRRPELTVLCTSRWALRLQQEQVITLEPLSLADPAAVDVADVVESDAVRLFCDRARTVVPDFAVTPENAADIAALCRLLDGLPLALELAAARVRVLPPAQLRQRTGRMLQVLTGGSRDLPERQRSMRVALDSSARLLDPVEAEVFAQLSVFAGGATIEAAEAVCLGGDDLFDVLTRLVDKSLLVADGQGRLSMLETIREYAAELLARSGDSADSPPDAGEGTPDAGEGPAGAGEAAVRRRHALWFAELAGELGPRCRSAPDSSTRGQLDAESSNLTAALEYAAATGDGPLLGQLVANLLDYWWFAGRIAQGERWLRIALDAPLAVDTRALLLLAAGSVALVEGDVKRAVPAFAGAVSAARELGDDLLIVRGLTASSVGDRYAGDSATALTRIDEALHLVTKARQIDPSARPWPALAAMVGSERGEILDDLGRTDEARSYFTAYQQYAETAGERSHLAWALANLAVTECEIGSAEQARQLAEVAVRASDGGDSGPVRADARACAGLVELHLGDPARAADILIDALRITHAAGQLVTLPDIVSLLGAAYLALDRTAPAALMLAAGEAWREDRGLAIVGRLARITIESAQAELQALPGDRAVRAEAVRRGAIPYGRIEAFDLPR